MKKKTITALALILTVVSLSGCASWQRTKKTWKSEFSNGIEREIIIKSQTGEVLYEDQGKFDIEVNNYRVKYVDESNKIHIVYLGGSTAIVNEID